MTIATSQDEPNSRAAFRGTLNATNRRRTGRFGNPASPAPTSHAFAAIPSAEAGQLYPDEDGPRDC